jgi:hypothetical protein
MVIARTNQGYQVLSESGKALSKKNLSHKAAKERLVQVEMFKHMKGKKKVKS